MSSNRRSAFKEKGFKLTIEDIISKTQELYLSDDIPWVVGYSGGKDSTAVLQLVWHAIARLPKEKQAKPVHVISTDTLVENPVVALWVEASLKKINNEAEKQGLPITAHRLTPKVENRFWVNVVGKGYPSPRPKFRWCTDRLKIQPSEHFIKTVVKQNGEAILVLGTRKMESTQRSASMKEAEASRFNTRAGLVVDQTLDRVWKYTPISEWSNDDVWVYLNQVANPWGVQNFELQTMYQGATEDNECPLVVDTSTPSCGDSRFGCYVCTLVGQDKSLAAMIQNDDEKLWMVPLLELRENHLDHSDKSKDHKRREWTRMHGQTQLYFSKRIEKEEDGTKKEIYIPSLVPGPYKEVHRHAMLRDLLKAQLSIQQEGPAEVKDIELLSLEDLEEIRRIWVMDKHELEDVLPVIYQEVMGEPYPGTQLTEGQSFGADEMRLLQKVCEDFSSSQPERELDSVLLYKQVRELLHLEHKNKTMVRRSKLYDDLERAIEKYAFANENEAMAYRLRKEISSAQIKLKDLEKEKGRLAGQDKLQREKEKELRALQNKLTSAKEYLKQILELQEDEELVHIITPQQGKSAENAA